jgi:hypothetical protein
MGNGLVAVDPVLSPTHTSSSHGDGGECIPLVNFNSIVQVLVHTTASDANRLGGVTLSTHGHIAMCTSSFTEDLP